MATYDDVPVQVQDVPFQRSMQWVTSPFSHEQTQSPPRHVRRAKKQESSQSRLASAHKMGSSYREQAAKSQVVRMGGERVYIVFVCLFACLSFAYLFVYIVFVFLLMPHDCFCCCFNCTIVAVGVTGMLPNQQFSPRGTFSDTSPRTSFMSQGSTFQSSMSHSGSKAGREREHPKVKPSISAPAKGGGMFTGH